MIWYETTAERALLVRPDAIEVFPFRLLYDIELLKRLLKKHLRLRRRISKQTGVGQKPSAQGFH